MLTYASTLRTRTEPIPRVTLLRVEFDDARKLVGDERRAADERPVNVGARHQVVDVRVVDAATVLDDHGVGHLLAVVVDKPRAKVGVRLLRHLRRRSNTPGDIRRAISGHRS